MSATFPDPNLVIASRKLYHRPYGSKAGPDAPWLYWKTCYGYMAPRPFAALRTIEQAEAKGLTYCGRCWGADPKGAP